ncbi:MAG: [FeFe] hydrogenase, group A [Atopobiaceae bacterium]|nr:[FeFe] hydrogenase, group A [Atopobiaceae bacterium]MCI1318660.1 [FeFe] hydrogenase, group A [Atopobiaceae bacterium]MCI1389387.1 [FeFe] hydrogenase, group A [Atopobiaceae bacterium]MCI1432450.1 [FeFe] hydrogenase, group A [Atopobiaceae bacterium]MCI1470908.1 [FeFe] hydrogenase, group A [Atopobiaceae bacterium]
MVTVTIDGREVQVPEHTTILEAARAAGVEIPTLCYLKDLNEVGACRVCVVEVEGIDQLVASCNNYVLDGMVVRTNSPKVRMARKTNVELLLSQHDSECTSCVRSGNCSLQTLANDLGIFNLPYEKHLPGEAWDTTFPLIRNNDKCIKCLRCINVCSEMQATGVWDIANRAGHANVNVVGGRDIKDTKCALCGQCITHCPTGALRERDDTGRVWDALADPDVTVIAQIAPSVRTAWGDVFGLDREQATVGRLVAALRPMGFDYILNTDFSADLTIMEEGTELLHRLPELRKQGWPMFTSCCPGWVRFIKSHYPMLVDNVSTAKSPQGMFGAVVKSYYAEMLGIDPHKIFSVSIMPCVAKKAEVAYPTMNDACGDPDVDCVLTVREVERMIRAEHVDVASLEDEPFDEPLGYGTGAGIIFGATGGVMEAALRTAYYLVTGKQPENDMFRDVRGLAGWKEATFDLDGTDVRVAVASGLGNADRLCSAILAGEVSYDFVEIMACPGGCVGGGGQPIHDGEELAGVRGQVLYGLDRHEQYRNSHDNPQIKKIYADYFGEPNSELAEHLLHTDLHGWWMPGEKEALEAWKAKH